MSTRQGTPSISGRGSWQKPLLGMAASIGSVVCLFWMWSAVPQTPVLSIIGIILFGVLNIPMFTTFAILALGLTLFELRGNPLFGLLFQIVKPFVQLAAIVLYLVAFLAAIFFGFSVAVLLSLAITFLLVYVHALPHLNTATTIYLVVSGTVIFVLLWGSRVMRWLLTEWRKQRDFAGLWLDNLMPWIDHERMLQFGEPALLSPIVYALMLAATVLDVLEQVQGVSILFYPWWIAYKEVALFVLVTVIGFDNLRDKALTALQKIREAKVAG
jgi:hypothetical protein